MSLDSSDTLDSLTNSSVLFIIGDIKDGKAWWLVFLASDAAGIRVRQTVWLRWRLSCLCSLVFNYSHRKKVQDINLLVFTGLSSSPFSFSIQRLLSMGKALYAALDALKTRILSAISRYSIKGNNMMKIWNILRTLLACFILLFAENTQAATVTLSGRAITIPIPSGYCEFGSNPADEAMMKRTKNGIGNDNQLVAGFGDCRELEELHSGRIRSLSSYGVIVVQAPNNKIRKLQRITRSQFIQELSKAFSNANTEKLLKVAEDNGKRFVQGFQSAEILGPLGANRYGVYYGLAGTVNDDEGRSYRSIGVMGLTLIKEFVFSVNLYRVDPTSIDLRSLLMRNKSALSALVHENE